MPSSKTSSSPFPISPAHVVSQRSKVSLHIISIFVKMISFFVHSKLFLNISSGGDNSNRTLITTVIVLVVGVIGLVVAVALLFMKMKRIKGGPEREGKELGVDNAPNGKQYVIDDEGDGKKGETVM